MALGIARAAIDELVQLAQSKRRINSSAHWPTEPTLISKLHGQRPRCAVLRAFFYQTIEAAWSVAERGDKVAVDQRRDIRLATTHAVEASIKAVNAMYTLGGGSAVYAGLSCRSGTYEMST